MFDEDENSMIDKEEFLKVFFDTFIICVLLLITLLLLCFAKKNNQGVASFC